MSTVLTLETGSELDNFVALSALLTGIDAAKLRPTLDTHGTAQTYLEVARSRGGGAFVTLVNTFIANRGKAPAEQGAAIFEQSGDDVAWLARSIMLLWYLGSWYDPKLLPGVRQNPPAFVPSTVVSADAYTQGWVWRVGQTHPMGYSDWRFGYWHTAPPPLSSFVGGGGQ